MLRTSVGAADALVGRGMVTRRVIARSTKLTTTATPSSMVIWRQAWARGMSKRTPTSRVGFQFRTSPSASTRWWSPFHWSKGGARRSSSQAQTKTSSGRIKPPPEPTSISARLKKLSREYGWAAVGVYMGLSVLDFPFCFLLVRIVGTERIAEIEHVVVDKVGKFVPENVKTWWANTRQMFKSSEAEQGLAVAGEDGGEASWGVEEAQQRKVEGGASLATQLALAYAIHKSFIFVRVPLTAAILPKVVKVLRSWGWQVGKKAVKP